VPDFVAIKTSLRDSEVWVHDRFGQMKPLRVSREKLYVDPKSGLLKRNKRLRSWSRAFKRLREVEARERAKRMRVISADKQLHLLDDCWWEVRLAPVPDSAAVVRDIRRQWGSPALRDALLHDRGPGERAAVYGRHGVYAVSKRQLSKREKRALKLN
jgi:hypothetical protein